MAGLADLASGKWAGSLVVNLEAIREVINVHVTVLHRHLLQKGLQLCVALSKLVLSVVRSLESFLCCTVDLLQNLPGRVCFFGLHLPVICGTASYV